MKFMGALLAVLLLLSGCGGTSHDLDRPMALRSRMLQSQGCRFETEITADYGDSVHIFSMTCQTNTQGDLDFAVTEPQTISGITGTIAREEGSLTFTGTALQFDTLVDDQITPVSAPWILTTAMRGGYLTSAGMEDGLLRVGIDDAYCGEELHVDVWLSEEDLPVKADILYGGRRIVSLNVRNFTIL